MKKKSLVVLAMAAAMVLGGAMTAHAEETQWYVYGTGKMSGDPAVEDNLAQAEAWAERHKGDIDSIENIEDRYAAVVNEVINFLDYDTTYMHPMVYYTIRDQKGVCGDYTLLTGALCEKVGIEHVYESGILMSAGHPILKVNINGDWRYSDPTNFESGAVGLFGTAHGWVAENFEGFGKMSVAAGCGTSGDELIEAESRLNEEYSLVRDRYGNEAWVSRKDKEDMLNDVITIEEYLNKYGLRQ